MIFIIDFDGTIAPVDTVDSLLEHFATDAWRAIEQEWVEGKISSRVCMQRQLGLVTADRKSLEEFFAAVEVDPAFVEFVRHAETYAKLAVVSDGLDYPIRLTLDRIGLSHLPVYANATVLTQAGVGISFPHFAETCTVGSGVCKCAVARSMAGNATVLIGDGRSDFCLATTADHVFSKGSLTRHCESAGIPHTPFTSFRDILRVVREWDITRLLEREAKSHAIKTAI
jgi:2,3-diketo-5-methylthio-1-phosphopentane phosphatase